MNIIYIYSMCFLMLCSCCAGVEQKNKSTTLLSGNVMTRDYRVIVGGALSTENHRKIENILAKTFEQIDTVFNNWNPNSEISKLNALEANIQCFPSTELYRFLRQTEHMVQLTDGLFDPTIEPLRKLWRTHLEHGDVPDNADILNLSKAVGWDHIHLHNGSFYKDNALTSIDLGGIVKGHCVDLLVEKLNDNGFTDVFVDWGGEIRSSGCHPEGRAWKIFISNLGGHETSNAIAEIELHDQAIATSGDYMQNWTVIENGKAVTYFHIIDPRFKRPLIATKNSIASASVEAPSCALADGIATALMLFPTKEEAHAWISKIKSNKMPLKCWLASREDLD
jgi:thiamine biosynthesis lipoprotein